MSSMNKEKVSKYYGNTINDVAEWHWAGSVLALPVGYLFGDLVEHYSCECERF